MLGGGSTVQAMDGLIAATARVHVLELVTRNVRDFEAAGVAVCNPWSRLG
jgi:toxin FitB